MSSSRRFRFVQVEYPWALGPDPGRYPIREQLGEPPRHVLVLRTLGAAELRPRTRARGRRRGRDAEPSPPPRSVATSSATMVDATALHGTDAAERWLRDSDLEAAAVDAVARLNRVLHAHRIATADSHVHEVRLSEALVVRVGYGTGEHVADGRWHSARELGPPSRATRRRREPTPEPSSVRDDAAPGGGRLASVATGLRPVLRTIGAQERLTALLGCRDAVLASEELALRARADLAAGRWREAALQLMIALDAALAELEPWREPARISSRLDALSGHHDALRASADAALQGGLDAPAIELMRDVLATLEATLRARAAAELRGR